MMSTENENITVDVRVENQYDCVDSGERGLDVGCVEIELQADCYDSVRTEEPVEVEVQSMSSDEYTDDSSDGENAETESILDERQTVTPIVDIMLDDGDDPNTPPMSDEDEDDHVDVNQQTNQEGYGVAVRNFRLLQTFRDAKEFRKSVEDYSVASRRPVKIKSAKERVSVKCKNPECPWRIWCSIEKRMQKFQIKTYKDNHTCLPSTCNSICGSRWLASRFLERFRRNNGYRAADLRAECLQMYGVTVSYHQCFRARQKALRKIQGNQAEHFAKLRSYQNELLRTNRGSTVIIKTDDSDPANPVFRRMYVCFDALRRGWSTGCRPIIGLDGAFLKWFVKGELLAAVGRDANNQMFPIAWAVVEVENTDSWTWFMTLLMEDLALGTGNGFTLVSDGQKGLLRAIKDVLPNASHRNCGRHIYANWRKVWKQRELKPLFWGVARASTIAFKDEALAEVRKLSPGAAIDLERSNMEGWCRAFFNEDACCDVVHNNMSESFNSSIREARANPIISMLEDIRVAVMERMTSRIDTISKWNGDITPKAQMEIAKNLEKSAYATLIHNGRQKWEVRSSGDACVVDMEQKSCTCREWALSGIPCFHALAVISRTKGDITDYISMFYTRDRWELTYESVLNPINGERMWPKSEAAPIHPPRSRKMPGRPKRNRVRDPHESPQKMGSLTRHGRIMTCSHCHDPGHNKASCSKKKSGEPPSESHVPITKAKMGRPRTEASEASTSGKKPRKPKEKTVPAEWNRRTTQ